MAGIFNLGPAVRVTKKALREAHFEYERKDGTMEKTIFEMGARRIVLSVRPGGKRLTHLNWCEEGIGSSNGPDQR